MTVPTARPAPPGGPAPLSAGAGVALLAGAGVLWGGAGAAGRMLAGVGSLSSVQVAAARALIGGVGLLLAGLALRRPWLSGRRARRHVGVMAALTVAYQGCYFAAIAAGSLSLATLVALGSSPVFVTVIEAVRHRRLSGVGSLILAGALAGLALLIGPGAGGAGPGLGASPLAVVAPALGAGLAFALITLVNADPVPGCDHLPATGLAFVLGGGVLAGAAVAVGAPAVTWSPPLAGWLLVLGLVCTAAPYGLYFTGLPSASAALGALFSMLEPLFATLIAVVAFGERLTPLGWAGAGLLLGAVAVAAVRGPEDPAGPAGVEPV
nr:DMT family transporter [Propionibacterium sp.]